MNPLVSNTPNPELPKLSRHYLLKPWRLATLGLGMGTLFYGAHEHLAMDWDYTVSALMGLSTYVCAPTVVGILERRQWRLVPWAILLTWVCVDLLYTCYWYVQDMTVLPLMRSANFLPSLMLFFLAGMIWRKQRGEN